MTSDQGKHQISWRDFPTFVTIVGAVSIALAISRQLGFFFQIDPKLLSFFSVEDILRNSLAVVPITLFAWAIGFSIAELAPNRLPSLKRFLFEMKHPVRELQIGLLFAVFIILFFVDWPIILIVYSIIIYGAVISCLHQRNTMHNFIGFDAIFALFLIIQAFLAGATEAHYALRSREKDYEISLKNGTKEDVLLLRVTSGNLLVIPTSREIWSIPRSEVSSLTRKSLGEPTAFISLSGIWEWLSKKFSELSDGQE